MATSEIFIFRRNFVQFFLLGMLDIGGPTLVACTAKQILKLWNVARTTPKALGSGRRFEDADGNLYGDIRQLRANCNGTRVALLVDVKEDRGGQQQVLGGSPLSSTRGGFGGSSPSGRGKSAPAPGFGNPAGKQEALAPQTTKIFVYDVELDAFTQWEGVPDSEPISMTWDPRYDQHDVVCPRFWKSGFGNPSAVRFPRTNCKHE